MNVYIDGVDKTSEVSGSLSSWSNKKTIKFTSEATTIGIFGRDYECGCNCGGFALKCTSSDPDWNNLTTDDLWKVKGSSEKTTDMNKVCPSNWASPEYDDSTWENAKYGGGKVDGQGRWVPPIIAKGIPDICGDGSTWCFRRTVVGKTQYHLFPRRIKKYLQY